MKHRPGTRFFIAIFGTAYASMILAIYITNACPALVEMELTNPLCEIVWSIQDHE